jgi:hypothetical protein
MNELAQQGERKDRKEQTQRSNAEFAELADRYASGLLCGLSGLCVPRRGLNRSVTDN